MMPPFFNDLAKDILKTFVVIFIIGFLAGFTVGYRYAVEANKCEHAEVSK